MAKVSEQTKAILILHGYRLDGSGSCIYVQNIARQFCRAGANVILFCQEPEPEKYDFVSEAYEFSEDGSFATLFTRKSKYPGSLIYVRPTLRGKILPVYVDRKFPLGSKLKSFIHMTKEEIQDYVESNVDALDATVKRFSVDVMYANHVIMMPLVASRVAAKHDKLRYFLIPHGSEIEYVIKKDQRFHPYAETALREAEGIVSGSSEMTSRISNLFKNSEALGKKIHQVSVGVDVDHFSRPLTLPREERLSALQSAIKEQVAAMGSGQGAINKEFIEACDRIDIQKARILVNFGRLMPEKGTQDLIVLAPQLIQAIPDLKIIIAGEGSYLSFFKEMVRCLQAGDEEAFFSQLEEKSNEGGEPVQKAFRYIRKYLETNQDYFRTSSAFQWRENIFFAGYLKHPALRYLLCLSDVAVFPSIVKEAYPLAFLEAVATGVVPLVSDSAGLKDGMDRLDGLFPRTMTKRLRIPMDENLRLQAMLEGIVGVFSDLKSQHRETLKVFAKRTFSWEIVCGELMSLFRSKRS